MHWLGFYLSPIAAIPDGYSGLRNGIFDILSRL